MGPGVDSSQQEKPLDIEDGELTESGGEEDGDGAGRAASKQTMPSSRSSAKLKNGGSSSSRPPPKKSNSSNNRRNEDGPATDHNRTEEPAVNERRGGRNKKTDRKRHANDESEGRLQGGRGKRKRLDAEPAVEVAASFEDELTAYQNTQQQRDRRRSREVSREVSRDPGPGENHHGRPPPQDRFRPPPPPNHHPDGPRHEGNRQSPPGRRTRPPRDGPPVGGRQHQQRPPRREEKPPFHKEKRVPCKFFLEGRCRQGDQCSFSHDVAQTKKLESCKFYVGGFCQKGPECVFMHGEFPCKFFHTGQQCYSGVNCKFSHEELSQEGRMALERFLEKENKGGRVRYQQDRPPSPFGHDRPPQQQYSPDPHNMHQDLSRGPLLPTPEQIAAAGGEENRRRRPDFFRDTMTEDYGPGGEPPYSNEFAVHDPGFQDGQHFGRPEHDKPDDFNNFRNGGSPPGSHHSDNSSQQHPPRMPKLFARLTNKRSEMDPGDVGGRGNAHEPSEEEPDSAGSGSGLMIDEPFSQQQQPSDLAPSSHAAFHSLGDRATDRWNNESDDEDDGGDQVLAQSLKRLQEWPERNPWIHGVAGEFYPEEYGDDDAGTVTFFPSPEELLNRGKVLLPLPVGPPPEYFPTTIHNAPPPFPPSGPPNHFPAGPPPFGHTGPGPMIHHEPYFDHHHPHHPHHQPLQWDHPEHGLGHAPPPFGHEGYPPEPYPPPHGPGFGPPPSMAVIDPRHRGALSPTGGDFGAAQPEPPLPHTGQTLEDVMQQLARKFGTAAPKASPVEAPEIDAAFARNVDPPLYRLEAIHIPKSSPKPVFERLINYRTVDELGKDPRIASMMKTLTPTGAVKETSPPPTSILSPVAAKVRLVPVESSSEPPAPSADPKKASQEFDAFTAMLNQALESSKKRDADEEAGRGSPGKRTRKLATTAS